MNAGPYRLDLRPRAKRQLGTLPTGVAFRAAEIVFGPLLHTPRRLGKPLDPPFEDQLTARCGRGHRIRYLVDDRRRVVVVIDISRRSDAYRPD